MIESKASLDEQFWFPDKTEAEMNEFRALPIEARNAISGRSWYNLESDDLWLHRAAHDAIEITELKARCVDAEEQLQIFQDQAHMEALASCGLCTCMEHLVDGRCEMCDPPEDDSDEDPTYYDADPYGEDYELKMDDL